MAYRCVATSVAGFVQQLAVCYVARGYYFYVSGRVPDHKLPEDTDAKIIAQYGIDVSKWSRARRKKAGLANVQYLRYGRLFVIVATHGQNAFFEAEAKQLRDVRVYPMHFMGYAIGCRQGRRDGRLHVSVRIHRELYRELKATFEQRAVHRSLEGLARDFQAIPYEPYAPVRDQLRCILRAVNRKRKAAGLELVPNNVLCPRRIPVKPFHLHSSLSLVPRGETPREFAECKVPKACDSPGLDANAHGHRKPATPAQG
jgi:hypothetical protein